MVRSLRILVTGSAGFIGYHLTRALLEEGHEVVGFDGLTPYYDVRLKQQRHEMLSAFRRFRPIVGQLEDADAVASAFSFGPEIVVHLAAQAGVRYSLEAPFSYSGSNVTGTLQVLEAARHQPPRHLMVASSSSVYGMTDQPTCETDTTEHPVSLYAATKKATEAITHSYSHLFGLPTTCLRFFTVYGPWGRPDMALFKFVEALTEGRPIALYGQGKMRRDFTYVGDVVRAVRKLMDCTPVIRGPVERDTLSQQAPWRVVNVAGGNPVELLDFVVAIEREMGLTATRELLPMQPGDVIQTAANVDLLRTLINEVPHTPLANGVASFCRWYKEWRRV